MRPSSMKSSRQRSQRRLIEVTVVNTQPSSMTVTFYRQHVETWQLLFLVVQQVQYRHSTVAFPLRIIISAEITYCIYQCKFLVTENMDLFN